MHEMNLLAKLNHPNIVGCYGENRRFLRLSISVVFILTLSFLFLDDVVEWYKGFSRIVPGDLCISFWNFANEGTCSISWKIDDGEESLYPRRKYGSFSSPYVEVFIICILKVASTLSRYVSES